MAKRLLPVFLVLVLVVLAFAQNESVDQLNDKAEGLLNQNPKESFLLAEKAKTAAETATDKKGQARAMALMGVASYKVDDYKKAKIFINQAEALGTQLNDTSLMAFCSYWQCNLELNQGNYTKALDLYQSGLQLAEKTGDKKNTARCLDGKGIIYEALGEDDKALDLYVKSLEVAQDRKS